MKKIIISILITVVVFFGFIGWGLYLMEIEDHYGDLQEIYFESQSGDLIINNETKKIGIITKNWKRADVITQQKDTLDLHDLIYINGKENKYEVFRPKTELNFQELDYEKLINFKQKGTIKSIVKN
ncbi:hypothetical protein ABGT15_12980 [Flavobacterium enshiense]|uniref:hypothetical protein n=1 Tax=Flavobacterium enshiense TaxID=1341165 RepID=UPI00345D6111